MVSYNVIISPKALSQLNDYVDYIHYILLNEQGAEAVWQDAMATAEALEHSADSLNLCSHPVLRQLGYYKILFRRHEYLMLYRIDSTDVYVEAIYHQLQDYQNTFVEELK